MVLSRSTTQDSISPKRYCVAAPISPPMAFTDRPTWCMCWTTRKSAPAICRPSSQVWDTPENVGATRKWLTHHNPMDSLQPLFSGFSPRSGRGDLQAFVDIIDAAKKDVLFVTAFACLTTSSTPCWASPRTTYCVRPAKHHQPHHRFPRRPHRRVRRHRLAQYRVGRLAQGEHERPEGQPAGAHQSRGHRLHQRRRRQSSAAVTTSARRPAMAMTRIT